jgi:MFS family permease
MLYKLHPLVILNASFFLGRVLSFKLWFNLMQKIGRKKPLAIGLLMNLLSHLGVFAIKNNYYFLCLVRFILGLFFPFDILMRLCCLDLSFSVFNRLHFHLINLALLAGQLISVIFNNDKIFLLDDNFSYI